MSRQAVINKLAAVSVLVAMIAGLAVVVWPLAQRYGDNAETIVNLRDSLGKFGSIARYQPQLEEARSNALPAFAQNWFLEQAPQGIATARLQSRLKAIAATNGAQIIATNEVKPRQQDSLTYLGIRVSMIGPITAIHGALREIETGRPYLFVESAFFRAEKNADRAALPEAVIRLQLEVYGVQQITSRQTNGESGS